MKILISLSAKKDTEVDRLKRQLRVRAKYDTLKRAVTKLVRGGATAARIKKARADATKYRHTWKCTTNVETLKKRIAAAMKRQQKLKPAHGIADLSSWEDDVALAEKELKTAKSKGANQFELDRLRMDVSRKKALLNLKRKRMAAKK